MALHDRAFLDKIEQFLLHPAVRALSLAQRVDFLEQKASDKGLSPEEITQCLKTVQARNGLAQLAQGPAGGALNAAATAAAATAGGSPAAGAASTLSLLGWMARKYGVAALILSLLGAGYLRFRQRLTEQLVVEYHAERLKRRAKRSTQVGALLSVIHDQQAQYKQAATLLQHRVERVAKMQQDALAQQSAATAGAVEMRKRHEEVHSLKSTLLQLKREVMNTLVQPPPSPAAPVGLSSVGSTAEESRRVATASIAVQAEVAVVKSKPLVAAAVQTVDATALPLALKPRHPHPVKAEKPAAVCASAPQVVSRPVNMSDLMGGQEDNDELSTSQSYRLLLATS